MQTNNLSSHPRFENLQLENKTILVTGGTGSFGKVFVKRLLSGEQSLPKKVIVFSRDEAKQHDMRLEFLQKKAATDEVIYKNFASRLEFRIGDIRSYADVCSALRGVDIVVNAAALKQVPACEYFPEQAILTNCIGPSNIVRAIRENELPVETVIGVSTDKACKPVNVMGMTKALHERIFISANILNTKTRFACVRYGNVLASRGSVIPLFHELIKKGGPLTITTPEMTRFLLNLDQAVDTVFAAIAGAKPGEIYIPHAPAALMVNIARALIGDRDIPIVETGIRPGEKIHEILVGEEEAPYTEKRGNFLAIRPMLPELAGSSKDQVQAITEEFSSGTNLLNYEATVKLLKLNQLMLEDNPRFNPYEVLR
ncbi:MAG: polysaccharide biosynthesis protein [Bdellovibrionales bacterium]